MKIDFKKISNIEIEDLHDWDAPDYCDAFISTCDYQGREATEEELDAINENSEFVHESTHNYLN